MIGSVAGKKNRIIENKISYINRLDGGILAAVFVMFIVLIIGVSTETQRYKNSQMAQIQDSMEVLADNQRVQFEKYISEKVSLLQALVTFPDIYEMDMERQKAFIRERSEKLGFHHLFIIKEDGTGFYVEEGVCRNQKEEPFFQDVMDNDVYITEPFYGADAATMTISVSILDEDYRKIGALCGAIELNEIREMFAANRMFFNGESYLINRDGYYMAAEDMHKVYDRVNIFEKTDSEVELIRSAFEGCEDKTGSIVEDGIEYQANVTYLKDYDWVIVQCIETKEIFKGLKYIDYWKYASLFIVAIIILCVIRIIVYWHRSNRKINTDTLTGCRSRAAMQNLLEKLEHILKYDITIIYLDLNYFKQVNDNYGHENGDRILCIFSRVLMEVFRGKGQVGRIGGDEFMVVLLNVQEEETEKLCREVDKRLREEAAKLEFECKISTAYGYAMRKKDCAERLEKVVTQADANMYRHKEGNRE